MQEADVARAGALKADAANASVGASDARSKVQPKLAVPDWITLIRKLRDEGKTDEAAKELTAFRAAYPDHERLLPRLRDVFAHRALDGADMTLALVGHPHDRE